MAISPSTTDRYVCNGGKVIFQIVLKGGAGLYIILMSNGTVTAGMYTLTPHINYFVVALIKLSLSTVLSFIISVERELHSHPGGVCTHTLVGFGSCLFTITSVHLRDNYPSTGADPARICAQIVSGMGFLGSATIFKSNNYVKGINTAANLWISAAISMAVGLGLWEFAITTAVFTILVLFFNSCYKKLRYGLKVEGRDDGASAHGGLSRDPLDAPYGDENSGSDN